MVGGAAAIVMVVIWGADELKMKVERGANLSALCAGRIAVAVDSSHAQQLEGRGGVGLLVPVECLP